jgi:hypothetical protein
MKHTDGSAGAVGGACVRALPTLSWPAIGGTTSERTDAPRDPRLYDFRSDDVFATVSPRPLQIDKPAISQGDEIRPARPGVRSAKLYGLKSLNFHEALRHRPR